MTHEIRLICAFFTTNCHQNNFTFWFNSKHLNYCNCVSQWWAEFDLIWIEFLPRDWEDFLSYQHSLSFQVSSSTLQENWVVSNLKSSQTQTQLIIVTYSCSICVNLIRNTLMCKAALLLIAIKLTSSFPTVIDRENTPFRATANFSRLIWKHCSTLFDKIMWL